MLNSCFIDPRPSFRADGLTHFAYLMLLLSRIKIATAYVHPKHSARAWFACNEDKRETVQRCFQRGGRFCAKASMPSAASSSFKSSST